MLTRGLSVGMDTELATRLASELAKGLHQYAQNYQLPVEALLVPNRVSTSCRSLWTLVYLLLGTSQSLYQKLVETLFFRQLMSTRGNPAPKNIPALFFLARFFYLYTLPMMF